MDYSRRRLIQRSRRKYERRFEEYRDVQPAIIFSRNGSIYVPGMPGYVWVHQLGLESSPMAVLRGRAPAAEGLWVWIGRAPKPPHRWQILDVYTAELSPAGATAVNRASLPAHAQNHAWPSEAEPGIDKLSIYQPALQMLKCTGDGSTLVVMVGGLVWGDGNRFLGGTLDLSPYVPATDSTPVLVYFDTATEALAAVVGNYDTTGGVYSAATIEFPTAPTTAINSAFVMLSAGQTAITTADHVYDARAFLTALGATGTSSSGGSTATAAETTFYLPAREWNNKFGATAGTLGDIVTWLLDDASTDAIDTVYQVRGGGQSRMSIEIDYAMESATSGDVALMFSAAVLRPGDDGEVGPTENHPGAGIVYTVPGTSKQIERVTFDYGQLRFGLIDRTLEDGDLLLMRVMRQASGIYPEDTATGDLHFIGARINLTSFSALLLETGDYLLLESGNRLLLE